MEYSCFDISSTRTDDELEIRSDRADFVISVCSVRTDEMLYVNSDRYDSPILADSRRTDAPLMIASSLVCRVEKESFLFVTPEEVVWLTESNGWSALYEVTSNVTWNITVNQ